MAAAKKTAKRKPAKKTTRRKPAKKAAKKVVKKAVRKRVRKVARKAVAKKVVRKAAKKSRKKKAAFSTHTPAAFARMGGKRKLWRKSPTKPHGRKRSLGLSGKRGRRGMSGL